MTRCHSESLHDSLSCVVQPSADGAALTGRLLEAPLLAAVGSCSDEREAVQKKTFTKWVNSHLSRVSCRITDLYMDLRDGRMLIKLLEVLSERLDW
ncbi:hypothetical protein NFI96_009005 [Prochilodus magdalenae]|nr:hypothetical protein NFI96_009005 [Prochilodus magdalenae]